MKKIKQDFKEGKENLVTADSKKEGTRRHYFAYMPMGVNGWILCYALPEQAAQQSYNFIEHYEISFYDRIYCFGDLIDPVYCL